MPTSRSRMTTVAQTGNRPWADSVSTAAATMILSASGSSHVPVREVERNRRASQPSRPSVAAPSTNTAAASQEASGPGPGAAATTTGASSTRATETMLGQPRPNGVSRRWAMGRPPCAWGWAWGWTPAVVGRPERRRVRLASAARVAEVVAVHGDGGALPLVDLDVDGPGAGERTPLPRPQQEATGPRPRRGPSREPRFPAVNRPSPWPAPPGSRPRLGEALDLGGVVRKRQQPAPRPGRPGPGRPRPTRKVQLG